MGLTAKNLFGKDHLAKGSHIFLRLLVIERRLLYNTDANLTALRIA